MTKCQFLASQGDLLQATDLEGARGGAEKMAMRRGTCRAIIALSRNRIHAAQSPDGQGLFHQLFWRTSSPSFCVQSQVWAVLPLVLCS